MKLSNLQKYTENFVKNHRIPSLSVAVLKNGRTYNGASGILNVDTGVEATVDSLFRIASVTKAMTATLVMQLVDERRIDIDMPLQNYLTDFRIADNVSGQKITIRQLLNHTSGIAGDFFPQDKSIDGPFIARYVDRCAQLPLVHPVGKLFSYSNAAYAIAGRLIEVMVGRPWSVVMRERIFDPLGMRYSIADPKEIVRYRASVGHVRDYSSDAGIWRVTNELYPTLGQAPAGSTVAMRPLDLILFAQAHMRDSDSNSMESWLSSEAVRLMQLPGKKLPGSTRSVCKYWGLGWQLDHYCNQNTWVISHAGGASGALCMLQLFPNHKAALAFALNCDDSLVYRKLNTEMAKAIGSIDDTLFAGVIELDFKTLSGFSGSYAVLDTVVLISVFENRLAAVILDKNDKSSIKNIALYPMDDNRFLAVTSDGTKLNDWVLFTSDNTAFVYFSFRLFPRVSRSVTY